MSRRTWLHARPSGPPPPWAPSNGALVVLADYDPRFGVTQSGGLVSALADQSGRGDANRDLAEATLKPTFNATDAAYNNQPTLSGAGWQLPCVGAWSIAPEPPFSILVVGELSANSSAFLSGRTSVANMLWRNAGILKFYGGATIDAAADVNVPSVSIYTNDGTDAEDASKLFVQDLTTPSGSAIANWDADTGFDLGVGVAGVSDCSGKIARALILGGVPDAAYRAQLVAYLNDLYGLGASS